MFLISVSSARIAAMAAMDGSIRNLISIRSLIIFCLSSTKVRPNGSSIIPGVAETYEPEPWRMVITLRDASARIASSNIQPFTHYGFVRKLVTRLQIFLQYVFNNSLCNPLGKSFFFGILHVICLLLPNALMFSFSVRLNILSNISLAFFFSVTPGKYSLYPIVV